MLELAIPGRPMIAATHLVLDINGTLTTDGELLPGVADRVEHLKQRVRVLLLTADTCGTARRVAEALGVELTILEPENGGAQKLAVVWNLGPERVIAIGYGQNDAPMIDAAALGIAVVQAEGAAGVTLQCADLVFTSIADALEALLSSSRLVATLRK